MGASPGRYGGFKAGFTGKKWGFNIIPEALGCFFAKIDDFCMVCCGDSKVSKLGVNRRRKFGTLNHPRGHGFRFLKVGSGRGSTTINHPYLFSNRVSGACLGMIHDRKSGVDPTFL